METLMETLTQMLLLLYIFMSGFNIIFLFIICLRKLIKEIKSIKKKVDK